MIGPDDIAAFADEQEDGLKAAHEFARRAGRGLPPDRWYDGTAGAEAVAAGIWTQAQMIALLSGAFIDLWNEKQNATRLFTSDRKG